MSSASQLTSCLPTPLLNAPDPERRLVALTLAGDLAPRRSPPGIGEVLGVAHPSSLTPSSPETTDVPFLGGLPLRRRALRREVTLSLSRRRALADASSSKTSRSDSLLGAVLKV